MKVHKQKYLQDILSFALLVWLSVGIKDEIWLTSNFLSYSDVHAYSKKEEEQYKNTKEFANYEKSHPLEYYEEEVEGKLFISVVESIKPENVKIEDRYGIEIEYTADCKEIKGIRKIEGRNRIVKGQEGAEQSELSTLQMEGWKKLGAYPLILDDTILYWKIVSGTTAVGVGTKNVAMPLILKESLPPSILVNWYYKEEEKEGKFIGIKLYIDVMNTIPSVPNLMLKDLKLPKETKHQLLKSKGLEPIGGFIIANYYFDLEEVGKECKGFFAIEFPINID